MLRRTLAAFAIALLATASTLVPGDSIADEPPDSTGRLVLWGGFGFQGRLTLDGVPANGTFNFQFLLYDHPVAGSQVDTTLSQTLLVTNGVFNTELNFNDALEAVNLYWVEVRVKKPSDPGFTLLNPRQALSPTAYAQVATGIAPGTTVNFRDEPLGFAAYTLRPTFLAQGVLGAADGGTSAFGVVGVALGNPAMELIGGKFEGATMGVFAESDSGYGIRAETDAPAKAAVFGFHNGNACTGGTPEAPLDQYCYGVVGMAAVNSTHGIGVYGYGTNTSIWGVAYTPSTYSGYFSIGDVGLGAGVEVVAASDRNLKRDIEPLGAGLDELLRLKPSSYAWKSQPDSLDRDYGFIAQDVKEVLPGLVSTTREGDLALDYNGFIPVIVGGVQELEARVTALESGAAPSATMQATSTTTALTRGVLALFAAGMLGAAVVGGVTGSLITRRR